MTFIPEREPKQRAVWATFTAVVLKKS
jgi:hypothetical protein